MAISSGTIAGKLRAMTFARTVTEDQIPVVDITALVRGEADADVGKSLHQASSNLGFIYVKGHGLEAQLLRDLRHVGMEFFRLPSEEKSRVNATHNHRGWLGPGQAKMDDSLLPDLKESFVWGCGNQSTESDHPLRGVNLWPSHPSQLEALAKTYLKQAHVVAGHLMRGFALGLGLSENFFLRSADRPLSRASLVYYPHQEETNRTQFGVGPHTDFGVLTVLCQDEVGGLQVQDIHGEWMEAPPKKDALVINVGDLLSRWTAGAYKSTPHRVLNHSGRERLSIVLAYDPNPETQVDPKAIYGSDYSGDLEPISCGDYLQWRFNNAFAYRT